MKRLMFTAALVVGALSTPAAALASTGISATPASTRTFGGGTCTAQFVRSASGIINETNRVCSPQQNPWTSADVYLQFRPQTGYPGSGPADPACDPNGLVTPQFTFINSESSIGGTPTKGGLFIGNTAYNTCVYLVNPQVASGTVDSSSQTGSTATLPTFADGNNRNYRIDVNGVWTNGGQNSSVDAQYNDGTNHVYPGGTWQEGFPGDGADWGRLLVSGAAVDWGTFNMSHAYSSALSTNSSSATLNVFDGDASSGTLVPVPGWYGDNSGLLTYTVTYLG